MFGYRSASPKVRLTTDRMVVRLVHERDAYRPADYYAENRTFQTPGAGARRKPLLSFRLAGAPGMITEMQKQGSAYYFILLDPEEQEVRGVANFSNVLRGSFHACFLGYSLGRNGRGKG